MFLTCRLSSSWATNEGTLGSSALWGRADDSVDDTGEVLRPVAIDATYQMWRLWILTSQPVADFMLFVVGDVLVYELLCSVLS